MGLQSAADVMIKANLEKFLMVLSVYLSVATISHIILGVVK